MNTKLDVMRTKLQKLEERNDKLCEDIADYQNICIDELCEEYANILAGDKDSVLSLLGALAKEIHKIYFD